MSYFEDRDLEIIESLQFNPDSQPAYDIMRDCLVWSDERADNLTPEGYEKMTDLWIIRGFIHKELLPSKWGDLEPEYFQNAWKKATSQNFKWIGFLRLKLNDDDQRYFEVLSYGQRRIAQEICC